MPKQTFSGKVLAVWGQIEGTKNIGLTSARTESLVDIIHDELKVLPRLVRYGEEIEPFDLKKFLAIDIARQPDDWSHVYYAPEDLGTATGSRAHNWTQWSSRLLGYGRGDHKYAPKIKVPSEVVAEMRAAGILTDNQYTTRFLSLEVVVFYLATQVRTWEDDAKIMRTKDRIEKQGIRTLGFIANTEEIDMDNVFTDEATPQNGGGAPIKTRIPKAGQALVGYNPDQAQADEAVVVGTTKDSGIEVADVDDILDDEAAAEEEYNLLDHLVDPEDDAATDAEIEAEIAALQAKLEARKNARAKERLEAEASKGLFVEGEVCNDKPQWAIVRIKYPDGQVVNYTRQESSVG